MNFMSEGQSQNGMKKFLIAAVCVVPVAIPASAQVRANPNVGVKTRRSQLRLAAQLLATWIRCLRPRVSGDPRACCPARWKRDLSSTRDLRLANRFLFRSVANGAQLSTVPNLAKKAVDDAGCMSGTDSTVLIQQHRALNRF